MIDKLKVGLLVDSDKVPAWVYLMLKQIEKSNKAEINLIIRKKPSNSIKSKSIVAKLYNSRNKLLYFAFRKLDSKIFKISNDAFIPIELKRSNCARIEVNTIETEFSDRLNQDDIKKIKSYKLDIVIRLGFKILRGEILNIAKYGVWSYHHGNNKINRGGPAGVWEVIHKHDVTGVTLQILNEKLDNGVVLAYSNTPTHPYSITRNINELYWHSASLLPRKISELYDMGENVFFDKVNKLNTEPHFYDRPLYKTPNNSVILKHSFKILYSIITKKIKNLYSFNQWILLYKWNKEELMSTSLNKFIKILPPKDRFWADPFAIKRDGKYYIFIEELMYESNKGHISVMEIDEQGNYSKPTTIIENDYHMSYPFLIEEDGDLFMIPETKENGTIELYKCVDFPFCWNLELTLMQNVLAVDTTIVKRDDKFWMYTNQLTNKGGSSHNELFLYYSEKLLTDQWTPHKDNPIISDSYSARSAGSLFTYKKHLYRPSQNCGKTYGYGLVINKVLSLNPEQYKEEITQLIYPNWDTKIRATHTLNSCANLTVIDAIYKRRRF